MPEETPTFELWNKLDLLDAEAVSAVQARAARDEQVMTISALTGAGLDDLQARIAEALQGARREADLTLSFAEGRKRAWLFEQDVVEQESQTEEGFVITVRWSAAQEAAFQRL